MIKLLIIILLGLYTIGFMQPPSGQPAASKTAAASQKAD